MEREGSASRAPSCAQDSRGMRHTGCDQSAVPQAKQLTWLSSLPFLSFPLFTFPKPPWTLSCPVENDKSP